MNTCVDGISDVIKDIACDENAGNDLPVEIKTIISGIIAVLGIVAVAIIIYAGIQMMTSKGEAEKVKKAKNIILYASIGLLICILSYAIVNFVITLSDEKKNTKKDTSTSQSDERNKNSNNDKDPSEKNTEDKNTTTDDTKKTDDAPRTEPEKEAEIDFAETVDKKEDTVSNTKMANRVIIIGASNVKRWKDLSMKKLLKKYSEINRVDFYYTAGVSWEDVLNNHLETVNKKIEKAKNTTFHIVFKIVSNDLLIEKTCGEDMRREIGRLYDSFANGIKNNGENTQIKLYLASLLPVDETKTGDKNNSIEKSNTEKACYANVRSNQKYSYVNKYASELAGGKGVTFIDLFTPLVNENYILEASISFEDAIHIGGETAKSFVETILNTVEGNIITK